MRTHVILSILVVLAGCGGQGDHFAPAPSRAIGLAGGSVTLGNGPAAGATAAIPAGAFVQPTFVSISPSSFAGVGGFSSVGPAFTVGPDVSFLNSETVTITAPAAPPANASMANVVVLLQTSSGAITVLPQNASTSSAVSVSASTFGTFMAVIPVPIDPIASTVTGSPSSVPADGTSTALVTVTVLDASGAGVPDAVVTVLVTGSNNTVSQPAPTDATGKTTATLSSTTAETKSITVAVVSAAGGAPTALLMPLSVTFQ